LHAKLCVALKKDSPSMRFVHLGIHTEFSITESIVRIPDLVKAAVKDDMPALALTDLSNLHAAVKFYEACLKKGIKPVLGSVIRLNDAEHRATLLAMSSKGWRNLTEIVSRGFIEGQQLSIPCVQKEWILEQSEDLIVLLGQHSDVGKMLCSSNPQKAEPLLEAWIEKFGNRVYLALTRTERVGEEDFIQQAVKLAAKYQIGVVAHNDVHFVEQDDFEAHEARVCIADGYVLGDDKRPKNYSSEQYFKTGEQMSELFSDIPSAIENTYHIAKRCNVALQLGTYFLPDFPIPDGYTIDTYFEHLSRTGLEERLNHLYPIAERDEDWAEIRKPYDDRIKYEVDIILKMGFPGYFLIVMDFIQWAKNNGVPVGPGRGSGAGSLVAYSLKITDLDPLRYDLLFERFLNPERVSMPDFDVDFCIAGRDRVIEYVAQNYGREAVSQIATFGTMAAKGAIRDVARVLGKSYGLADRISKMIPTKPLGVDLVTAIDMEPQLKDIVTNPSNPDNDDAAEIWEMALKLEGITRNTGKHAGGVVIAPGKITDYSAVLCEADGTSRVAQYDKDDVEAAGLVKFDFLGLRNLTVIEDAVQNINKRIKSEIPLEIANVPLDDKDAYLVFANANTTAVFQFESVGMKKMLKEARPSKFEEIIAFVSLYRPGPMDLIPDFIHRMHGGEFEYLHPLLEGVLEPTYYTAVSNLLSIQARNPAPWLLFLTTRADKQNINARVLQALIEKYCANLRECAAFKDASREKFAIETEVEVVQATTEPKGLLEVFLTGLCKWFVGLALEHTPPISVEVISVFGYRVDKGAEHEDLVSLALKFMPTHIPPPDPLGLAACAVKSPDEGTLATRALRKIAKRIDADLKLAENSDLLQSMTEDTANLLSLARYDAEKYRAWAVIS
jgi:DNA polymerase-3 subunit alpha